MRRTYEFTGQDQVLCFWLQKIVRADRPLADRGCDSVRETLACGEDGNAASGAAASTGADEVQQPAAQIAPAIPGQSRRPSDCRCALGSPAERSLEARATSMGADKTPSADDGGLSILRAWPTAEEITLEAIRAGARSWNAARGSTVYVLLQGAEVVYIGQTIDISARLRTHHTFRTGSKRAIYNGIKYDFDRVFVIHGPQGDKERRAFEKKLIHKFRPPFGGWRFNHTHIEDGRTMNGRRR